jgi:hypothetical protein
MVSDVFQRLPIGTDAFQCFLMTQGERHGIIMLQNPKQSRAVQII